MVSYTNAGVRLVTYNVAQGGSRDHASWERVFSVLAPDMLFVQESRDPVHSWLPALPNMRRECWLWSAVPGGRWGSGLWVCDGCLTPLAVPEPYTGRVVAAVVEGRARPGTGMSPVVALSIHAPTRKGSSYVKEVGLILDFAAEVSSGCPLVLAGDFNVVVGLRQPGQRPSVTRGERDLLQRLREEFDLVPCWQTAHPGEPLARTLRWMRRSDSLPYHCDGIFVPATWASALQSCEVLEGEEWCALSDHNPVVATLAASPPYGQ
ncbi:MAG TPA: endonuclease/exonuclease/phosphatase family protein [Chloroflexia bacterium]|nr:endonuclease/exonuclease/phosphatase family protein [Chloroflexia bacterium]